MGIVTESDQKNPCISYMKKMHPAVVEVQSRSFSEDACAILQAHNLAISFGTFGPALVGWSPKLRHLHVPFGKDNGTAYEGQITNIWYRGVIHQEGMPEVTQHLY